MQSIVQFHVKWRFTSIFTVLPGARLFQRVDVATFKQARAIGPAMEIAESTNGRQFRTIEKLQLSGGKER